MGSHMGALWETEVPSAVLLLDLASTGGLKRFPEAAAAPARIQSTQGPFKHFGAEPLHE